MEQSLTNPEMCILLRNDVQIWLGKQQAESVQKLLSSIERSTFIHLGERTINSADIIGVLPPQDIEDVKRRKNGEFKCKYGFWHHRGDKCDCKEVVIRGREAREMEEKQEELDNTHPISKEKLEMYKRKFQEKLPSV